MLKTSRSNVVHVPRVCHFCVNAIDDIDYKDIRTIQRFMTSYAKIASRRRTGTCTKHQRKLAEAIKRARFLALVPFTLR
ncbi:MAG: 30S ribosomal protein S18 [Candidatus Kerfeldbacteria bacterium]|nr:30S ribosomal protein S18 [Candidatus Kerfeldbacteria bacterium]